jgi:MFS family permease
VADTQLERNDISDVVSLFSATFVTFQPIMTLLGRRFGPRVMIPTAMLCWGVLTTAQMALNGRAMLMAVRLLLGVFEAGFVPIAYYCIGTCYPRYMAGLRLGLFAGMFSISGAFASLIAYGIFQIQNSRFKDWQLLFMIQGIITLAFAMVNAIVIPSKLSTYWIFTPEEREHAVYRLRADNADVDGNGTYQAEEGKITWINIKDALMDLPKLSLIAFNMLATIPVYGFTFFMPLIVQGMGYSGTQSNLMAVSPFVV